MFQGTVLATSPGPISAADQDRGINAPVRYAAAGDHGRLVAVDRDTGQLSATDLLLQITQPVTIVIKVSFCTLCVLAPKDSPRGGPQLRFGNCLSLKLRKARRMLVCGRMCVITVMYF